MRTSLVTFTAAFAAFAAFDVLFGGGGTISVFLLAVAASTAINSLLKRSGNCPGTST